MKTPYPYWPDKVLNIQVWQLAWPMMLSNMTVPLLGLADTAILGHLPDPRYLAAIAVAGVLFSTLFWAFGFLRMGTTGLVAQAVGRDDGSSNRTLLAQSLALALAIAGAILLLQTPLIQLALTLAAASPDVTDEAWAYANIRIWGAPAVLCNYVLLGWFVGNQNTRIPLLLLTLTNLINILLNLLFVLGFSMRAEGVALGTIIAEYFSLLLGLFFCRRHLRLMPGHFILAKLRHLAEYTQLLKINRYLFIRTLSLLLCFAFFTAQGSRQGADVLAANAVLLTFLMLISNALDGFAHATEALSGRILGERNKVRFYQLVTATALWSLVSALLLTLTFSIFGTPIIHLLTNITSVRELASLYLPWLIILPLVGVWGFLLDGIFIGTSQAKAMQNTMLVSVFFVFCPVWWLTQSYGNHGLWSAFVSLFIARALTGLWVYRQLCRNNRWGF